MGSSFGITPPAATHSANKMRLSGSLVPVAVVLLVGCAGTMSPTSTTTLPSIAVRQPSISQSCMQPDAGKKSALIYVGDSATNDVFDFDYANCNDVGKLTGFSEPDGGCVDASGDVYIANFGGGNVVEYAHGGSSRLNTYSSGGEPIGCSVDAKGDVAVTSYYPAEVVVFAGGDPSKPRAYTGPCTFLSAMGYDDKGNLVAMGDDNTSGVAACGILSGSKSMIALERNFKGNFPGSTMWDGKYLAIQDQAYLRGYEDVIIQATLSGKRLVEKGTTVLECNNGYANGFFIVGKKNTPVNDRQGKVVIGYCNGLAYWHYPAGGYPFKTCPISMVPYGVVVSLKT